jgi:hypothetical protein
MPDPGWTPVWAMPNVTLDEPIEASQAALVNCDDERLRSLARHYPVLETFRTAFRDEFGTSICPTIGMVREDAPQRVKTVTSFGSFRDVVCVSAIVRGQGVTLTTGRPQGIVHSDAFDIYPWFPGQQMDGRISASTPALHGMHVVSQLQPQAAPALGNRSLSSSHIDDPLLKALLARWERCFVSGWEAVEDRRLFRSLEMARAAAKMPGGVDATEHHAGRAVALWVSAFEILVHDGRHADLKSVLSLLGQVNWLAQRLKALDRKVNYRKGTIQTNFAGFIYGQLYKARNDFLHGNPVTPETLRLEKSRKQVQWFAASLFRLALAAFLDIRLLEPANDESWLRYAARTRDQRLAEEAILIADAPEDGRRPISPAR